jgi:hypothetical protein
MSDNQDTNDQVDPCVWVDPPTPHKKETCIPISTIHPAALRSMSLKHDSLPDPQTHPQATKEVEDMDSAKNPTKTVAFMKPITIDLPDQSDQKENHIFKEPLTRDHPDQKELQLLQQTPTDSFRTIKVAASPFNAIEEEDRAYNEAYEDRAYKAYNDQANDQAYNEERMNLKNLKNQKDLKDIKNQMNMKSMEAFNRSPDTDSD